jgi:hypothetical protein
LPDKVKQSKFFANPFADGAGFSFLRILTRVDSIIALGWVVLAPYRAPPSHPAPASQPAKFFVPEPCGQGFAVSNLCSICPVLFAYWKASDQSLPLVTFEVLQAAFINQDTQISNAFEVRQWGKNVFK